jgi:hypothetical protein
MRSSLVMLVVSSKQRYFKQEFFIIPPDGIFGLYGNGQIISFLAVVLTVFEEKTVLCARFQTEITGIFFLAVNFIGKEEE